MKSRVLYPRFSLHVQPDGSLVALGEDLPACVVASDESDLERKLLAVGRSVDTFVKAESRRSGAIREGAV